MNVPHVLLVSYFVLGMITTASIWQNRAMEIEMSIAMEEEEEAHDVLRTFLTIMFVLTWPVVLYEMMRKE